MTGTQPGSASRWLDRITDATSPATRIRPMIAAKSLRCLRIAAHRVELGWAVGLVGAVLAAAGPLRFGSLFV